MGEAGHKVIVADADPTFGLNMTRFSKYVHSFHLLNNTKTYIEDMIGIFKAEKVDGFIPVSHIQFSINDSYASKGMKMSAFKPFGTLAIPDPKLVEELDNKFQFMAKCQNLGNFLFHYYYFFFSTLPDFSFSFCFRNFFEIFLNVFFFYFPGFRNLFSIFPIFSI